MYSGYWKDNNYHGEGKLNNLEKADFDEPIDWRDLNTVDNYWENYEGLINNYYYRGV